MLASALNKSIVSNDKRNQGEIKCHFDQTKFSDAVSILSASSSSEPYCKTSDGLCPSEFEMSKSQVYFSQV